MTAGRVLLVDDEPGVVFGVGTFLRDRGFEVLEASDLAGAQELMATGSPDAALLDQRLPDGEALELLPQIRERHPDLPVVILTGHGSIELAVRAIKVGAEHFLTKPVELEALRGLLEGILERNRGREGGPAGTGGHRVRTPDPFLGTSPAITRLAEEAARIVSADSPVLLQGETGTGKGVLARWLHEHGPRRGEALVDLNCAGLARELLESELFGHERGAFTGATSCKQGLVEIAHRGTLFLDEIGDVDLQIQPKLLQVLEEKRFRRLGGLRDRTVDVRLIAASHRDLTRLAAEERFRRDLYFRISTVPLRVPSLRERIEDLPFLAEVLLRSIGTRLGRPRARLEGGALDALAAYPWPGNVRELRNVLERSLLLTDRDALERSDLRFGGCLPSAEGETDGDVTLQGVERRHIERILRAEGGHVPRAARRLAVPRSSLYQKLKKLGIDPAEL
ncbi:MAG TPA: sigma-54 dependent transcriptional regulator [Thermoanaerobaculia bacterium]